jgi:hypothetical protein
MIFFVVTTCLLNDCPIRNRNTPPVSQLETVKNLNLSHFKEVVKTTAQETHFDELAPPNSTLNILYTENNRLVAEDKAPRTGTHDCIHHHAVADDDFVVK